MTTVDKVQLTKALGETLFELQETMSGDDFRVIFMGAITAVIHRTSDAYWAKMITRPPASTFGPETQSAAQEFIDALDKYRKSLHQHASDLNKMRDLMNLEKQKNKLN